MRLSAGSSEISSDSPSVFQILLTVMLGEKLLLIQNLPVYSHRGNHRKHSKEDIGIYKP